jgi:ribonuclease J
LWAIPLGGLGEFGMNMLALRFGDEIIVIDAGLMFPEQELLGVDIVIPDITYLKQNKRMVKAIVLTHAHEDHIGSIPYILPELNVPIYGTQFTLAIVKKKLEEHGLLESAKLTEIAAGDTTTIGPFTIEYLHVTHSTVDCVALAVRTPVGVIIHTGDFKIDPTPVDGKPFDRARAFQRQHQRGTSRLHALRTRRHRSAGRIIPRRAEKSCGLLFLQLRASHSASNRHCQDGRPEGWLRWSQHG